MAGYAAKSVSSITLASAQFEICTGCVTCRRLKGQFNIRIRIKLIRIHITAFLSYYLFPSVGLEEIILDVGNYQPKIFYLKFVSTD